MKRTKDTKPKPDAIITADWHLREDIPVARTDDFWKAQWDKVTQISRLQVRFNCPVIHAGDLFNHWKPSPYLLSKTIEMLPWDQFYTIYGNHDLPQHNILLAEKCGVNVLKMAGRLGVLNGVHWGETPLDDRFERILIADKIGGREILVWHTMTYQGKKPWPGMTDPLAAGLLRKYPEYDLIVTGHNHKTFVEEHEGRLLVNPGSLTRQASDQVDHKPSVFLYFAETNTVERYYLKCYQGVISREHIEQTEKRDKRIDAFISKLDTDWEAEMSFEDNLERFAQVNKLRPEIMNVIQKAIEQ